MTGDERYIVVRNERTLRIVDRGEDLDLAPEAGISVCFVGGDAEVEVVQARAAFVCDALNAFDEDGGGSAMTYADGPPLTAAVLNAGLDA